MDIKKAKIIKIAVLSISSIILIVACSMIAYAIIGNNQKPGSNIQPSNDTDAIVDETTNQNKLMYGGDAPVYVTIFSHNEDSWSSVVNTKTKYEQYRAGLLQRIDLLESYGIEWDWQSDQPVVQAMVDYESDPALTAQTDGKNILVYMHDLGISLDPHAHTNNYADIAYLIEKLGAKASSVIGGLAYIECGREHLGFLDFTNWHEVIELQDDGFIYGSDFPQATWEPKILSTPGMGGHWFDEYSSGVWRPGEEDDFYTDQGTNNIIYIGKGYAHDSLMIGETHASGAVVHSTNGQYIKELVKNIENGEFPTGTVGGEKYMYTASIHVRDTDIVSEGEGDEVVTVDGLKTVLDELAPLQAQGKIIYVTFEQAADIWQNEYNSVPWHVKLDDFKFYDEVYDQGKNYCTRPKR